MNLFALVFFILPVSSSSPLADYSDEWNDSRFKSCNTAENVKYLSSTEKEVIYVLNLMRSDPRLFYKTVVKNYPSRSGNYHVKDYDEYKSLLSDMSKQKPLPLLYPDAKLYSSAVCHATSSGQRAYVGHRRSDGCKSYFDAECCDYGRNSPLDIIMGLLIDHEVESLGHRKVLMSSYNKVGVAIKPHKQYGTNTVLDFGF